MPPVRRMHPIFDASLLYMVPGMLNARFLAIFSLAFVCPLKIRIPMPRWRGEALVLFLQEFSPRQQQQSGQQNDESGQETGQSGQQNGRVAKLGCSSFGVNSYPYLICVNNLGASSNWLSMETVVGSAVAPSYAVGIDFCQLPGNWVPKRVDLGAKFRGQLAPRSSNVSQALPQVFSIFGDLGAIFQRDWSTDPNIVRFSRRPSVQRRYAECVRGHCEPTGRPGVNPGPQYSWKQLRWGSEQRSTEMSFRSGPHGFCVRMHQKSVRPA